MPLNFSPWLRELKRTRPLLSLQADPKVDVAIVGGGIAGVMTAYFTLRYTSKEVLLIEGNKIAHGATGHNAGQLVSYFERPFADLVKDFGLPLAVQGQAAVESAWLLLEEMYQEAKLQTPLAQFTGYAGCKDYAEVLSHLEDNLLRVKGGLAPEGLFVAQEAPYRPQIPKHYEDVYSVLPQADIVSLLETADVQYTATLASRKGVMNSALLCEEVVGYLFAEYPERFSLVEHTPIKKIVLRQKTAELAGEKHTVTAGQVVLCTNGFERLTLENTMGADIDTKFHHLVRGYVGYMAGYLEPLDKPPIGISYLPKHEPHRAAEEEAYIDPYFYLTRRPYEMEAEERHNLVCVGGPEALMDDTNNYSKEHPYPQEAQRQIDTFLRQTYRSAPKGSIDYTFRWHGLMCYTPTGVRCVGYEPCNSVLLYNLGCNGIGILPSIYGGRRIASLLAGEAVEPSMFDPRDSRCEISPTITSKKADHPV